LYDIGLGEDTRPPTTTQQLQHNRPFSWFGNSQEILIMPLILKQPAGAHKPFNGLEALAINEALDT